ncbi:MAG: hypothetical protein M3023_01850 [Pseudomonadota bacterium]|nr:hypothetical protein [Pseudomonadota bacterium]
MKTVYRAAAEPARDRGRAPDVHSRGKWRRILRRAMIATGIALTTSAAVAGDAAGTVTYNPKSGALVVTIKHAYLVTGPDFVSRKTIRRVVLSVADVGAKLAACETMSCSDGGIAEGMTLDFDGGPRINYWFVGNRQLVQYSGTADPASLKLTADTGTRIAGKWELDASGAGGPRVQIEFDAPLVKEITKL